MDTEEVTVEKVNCILEEWAEEFRTEAIRAMRGLGKYRLANAYLHFFVSPEVWDRWSVIRKQNHIQEFFAFNPTQSQRYSKPLSAGLKGPLQISSGKFS